MRAKLILKKAYKVTSRADRVRKVILTSFLEHKVGTKKYEILIRNWNIYTSGRKTRREWEEKEDKLLNF